MRNDQSPFTDPRVRQAIALLAGSAGDGARRCSQATARSATTARSRRSFPSTNTSVPQRDAEHRQGQAAAAGRRSPQRLLDHARPPRSTRRSRSWPQVIAGGGQADRRQDQTQGRDPDQLLRQGDVRQLRLARRDDVAGRLRRPRRPERVPGVAADLRRPVERRALQKPAPTTSSSRSTSPRSICRPRSTIAGKIETLLLRRRRS